MITVDSNSNEVENEPMGGIEQNVVIEGTIYHIRTELMEKFGSKQIISRVYQNGQVILSVRTTYDSTLGETPNALRTIHNRAIRQILKQTDSSWRE